MAPRYVEAALAYDRRQRRVIDAQIAVNAAGVAAFYLDQIGAREVAEHRTGMREDGLVDFFGQREPSSHRT